MSDRELCRQVAEVWVNGGGDYEGLEWAWHLIKDAVWEVLKERGMEGEHGEE